jgi:hypothetical protein
MNNHPTIPKQAFDAFRSFDSIAEASALCMAQPDPESAFQSVILANLQHGEPGFAKEMIEEMEIQGLI